MPTPPTGFPQPFGNYRLLRKLARGGMAELFLATDVAQRPVVIKRVLPHFTQETEFLKMFLNEARIAALLNHPGIVRVFDLGMEGEHLFIAMEFVDGWDLETLAKLSGGRLPPNVIARVGADVCDALYYANRVTDLQGKPLNVVHRDVTPGNVMVTRRGQVKLVDFGVAKAAAQLERTRPGVVKGKFRYMSPEQINFKELDGRSDLFSLGVLLYEVATGDRPFERKQLLDIINALTGYMPPPPADIVKGFPKPVSAAIMQALEKDRDTRYKHGREMQQALEQAIARTPTGKNELAAFIAELARAHPKELTPVAPEFDAPLEGMQDPPEEQPPTDPHKQALHEAAETSRLRAAKKPKIDGDLRTEAIPGDQMQRMIAEADRRAAKSATGSTKSAANRLPFSVGPPPEAEATAMALGSDEDDEETTTDPVGHKLSGNRRQSSLAAKLEGKPGSFLEGEPKSANPNDPDTLRLAREAQEKLQAQARSRSSPSVPAADQGAKTDPKEEKFDPKAFGDDDVDVPTISNVKDLRHRGEGEAAKPAEPAPKSPAPRSSTPKAATPKPYVPKLSPPKLAPAEEEEEVSVSVSVTSARARSNRSIVIVATVLLLAVLVVIVYFFALSFRPVEQPEQLRPGVKLGAQPLGKDALDPSKGPPKVAAPAEDPGEAPEEPEPSEPPPEPPPGTPTVDLAVDGAAGVRVSVGGRPFQEVPFTLKLPPGDYKCRYQAKGGTRQKACRSATVETGRLNALRVP